MVVAKYPATYGHTTVINNLCLGLKKLGHNVAIGAFSFNSKPPNNIEMIELKKTDLLFNGLKNLDFDIIHSHQPRMNYFLLFKKNIKPLIFHYHGSSDLIQKINFFIMINFFKNRISKIISVSDSGILQMRNLYKKIDAETIYNGVDTNFFKSGKNNKFKIGDPQLIFVSSLRNYKKVDFLITCIPRLKNIFPKIHLQIIGEGDEFKKLQKLIEKLDLKNYVKLTGKISDEELASRYASSDIYVSSSQFEVCPVPTLEAMSSGLPLLLCDIIPHEEIIKISNAGQIFKFPDKIDFEKKLITTLEKKSTFSSNAIDFSNKVDWEKICRNTFEIYKKVLK